MTLACRHPKYTVRDVSRTPAAADRRAFLRRAAAVGLSAAALGPTRARDGLAAQTTVPGAASPTTTDAHASRRIRIRLAERQGARPVPAHRSNGDEAAMPSRAGNFAKGLPHAQDGAVDLAAYDQCLEAMRKGPEGMLGRLPRGSGMRLVSPQAAFGLTLEGGDPQSFLLAPPPSISSPEAAAEMVELYWQALARDVPFADYATSPVTADACAELSRLPRFSGPTVDSRVTPETLFRGPAGTLPGPYLSQFLWKSVPLGSTGFDQRYRAPVEGDDFMESYGEWLQIQTGVPPWRQARWRPQLRHILTGRDLAEYVHYDFMYQGFLNAALILMNSGPGSIYYTNYYFAATNPYKDSTTAIGFATLGFAQVVDWLARVTTPALKAAWYQKWLVHRYLRPEEFAGLVHRTKTGGAGAPLHPDVLDSRAAANVQTRTGTYLLPQAFPEGCPLHPAYPSGHAAVAGACATVLKALFDEDVAVPDCVVPTRDGQALEPYQGPVLSVRGELEKLAFNVAVGRNFAGIHWRSDAVRGIELGEAVAISVLDDLVNTLAEDFGGFRFTKFNGERVSIAKQA